MLPETFAQASKNLATSLYNCDHWVTLNHELTRSNTRKAGLRELIIVGEVKELLHSFTCLAMTIC